MVIINSFKHLKQIEELRKKTKQKELEQKNIDDGKNRKLEKYIKW